MDNHEQNAPHKSLRDPVMAAIKKGAVHMKPRWRFVLTSFLWGLGSLIALCAVLYVASLLVFMLHKSGLWLAPSFGSRGWFDLLHSLPLLLLLLIALFALVLELLVRRYAFVYKTSLLTSLCMLLLIVVVGGYAIAQTPLHHRMADLREQHGLPPPFDSLYGEPFRAQRPPDVYRGVVIAISDHQFILQDLDTNATTSILITPRTRLPYGGAFAVGDMVFVMGDRTSSSSVEAFGIRQITE